MPRKERNKNDQIIKIICGAKMQLICIYNIKNDSKKIKQNKQK